jgi:hypothetical protein
MKSSKDIINLPKESIRSKLNNSERIKIKTVSLKEHFKNCFPHTVKLKENNFKMKAMIEDRLFDKQHKSTKTLSSQHIKNICNLLKTKDFFYSK